MTVIRFQDLPLADRAIARYLRQAGRGRALAEGRVSA
jgi:hypothetical protein